MRSSLQLYGMIFFGKNCTHLVRTGVTAIPKMPPLFFTRTSDSHNQTNLLKKIYLKFIKTTNLPELKPVCHEQDLYSPPPLAERWYLNQDNIIKRVTEMDLFEFFMGLMVITFNKPLFLEWTCPSFHMGKVGNFCSYRVTHVFQGGTL